jgi:hypothetical protein
LPTWAGNVINEPPKGRILRNYITGAGYLNKSQEPKKNKTSSPYVVSKLKS